MMKASSLLSPIAKRLEGKVAVITGGTSGIGEAASRLFAKQGAKVVIAGIQDEAGHALCKEIGSNQASFVHCDVTKESEVKNAVETAVSKHGKLDIMFGNAGIPSRADVGIQNLDYKELTRVLDVNIFGAFWAAKHAARAMIPERKGSIMFTASICSTLAGLAPHPYTVSKHAVVGLTKSLCEELGQHGIRVNCISPYAVCTPLLAEGIGITDKQKLNQIGRKAAVLKEAVLEAEDVAQAAVDLASDESKYVSGLNLVVDGGYSTTNPALMAEIREHFS